MEYHPLGEEKPHDVTEEFGGNNPFPFTFTTSGFANPEKAHRDDEPLTAYERRAASHSNFAITPEQSRNARERNRAKRAEASAAPVPKSKNFDRMRYYLANKDAILADVKALGPTEARKKWGIPSSTWTYRLRAWGVSTLRPAPRPQDPVTPAGMPRVERGKYWRAHAAEIEADLREIGPGATMQKWGMSDVFLRHEFHDLSSKKAWLNSPAGRRAQVAPEPATTQTAQQVTQQTPGGGYTAMEIPDGGDGKFAHLPIAVIPSLPLWNDGWNPVVQVEWLRAATTIAVVGMTRDGRKAEVSHG
jgi:hypothetical protein